MKLTVSDILSLAALAEADILAGDGGLERPVAGVRLWDLRDHLDQPSESLLLWPVGSGSDIEAEIVERAGIAERGSAAALVVLAEPGHREGLSLDRIRMALDNTALPVISLAQRTSRLEAIHVIESQLLDRLMDLVDRADLIHRELHFVAISGGDLGVLTQTLADLVQNPVGIRSMQFDVLADAIAGGPVDDARQRSLASGRVPRDVIQALERHEFQKRIRSERGPFRLPAMPDFGMRARVAAPIIIGDARYGYISIAERDHHLGALDLMAVEKAALVAALILSQQQEWDKNERMSRSSLAWQLIQGGDDQDSVYIRERRIRLMGYGDEQFVVFAIGVDLVDRLLAELPTSQRRLDLLLDQLALAADDVRFQERQRSRPLVLAERDGVALLQPVPAGLGAENRRGIGSDLKAIAGEVSRRIERLLQGSRVWIGIGRPVERDQVRRSYREARVALTLGRTLADAGITYYDDIGLYRLLTENLSPTLLRTFADEQLGLLLRYDLDRSGDLVRTLRLYLECGGNKAKTAALLPSHLNTVKYRLSQIADLTGQDPEDPEQRLSYQLAFKILDLQY